MATLTPQQQIAQYSAAELNAAAAKLKAEKAQSFSTSYLVGKAKDTAAGATALLAYLTPKATAAAPAAITPAAGFTLPDPNTAGTKVITSNGIQFQAVPGKTSLPTSTTPAKQEAGQWVASGTGLPGFMSVTVDSSGKPTVGTNVVYPTAQGLNLARQKATESATAAANWVDPELAAAKAVGFSDVASWRAALKASNAAGFGNDVTKYQAFQTQQAADKSAQAKGYTSAAQMNALNAEAVKLGYADDQALKTANTAAVKLGYKDAAAQKTADVAAQAKGYATDQAMKAAIEKQNALLNVNNQASKATNPSALAEYIKAAQQIGGTLDPKTIETVKKNILADDNNIDALADDIKQFKDAGIEIDQASISSAGQNIAQAVKTLDDVKAFNAKAQSLGISVPTGIVNQIANSVAGSAKSFADLKTLQDQVKSLGGTLDQSAIDQSIDAISKTSGAATREGLAAFQQQAAAAGFKPSQSFIDQQMATITKAEADAAAKVNSFKSTLLPPGDPKFNEAAQFGQVYKMPNSDVSFMARTENKINGTPAGWYQSTDGGKTYRPMNAAADAPGMTKEELTKAYFTDWAGNKLVSQGVSPEQATKMLADFSADYDNQIGSYGPGTSTNWLQGLNALTEKDPAQYARWQSYNVPAAKAEDTKSLTAELYDSTTGTYKNVTQDQLNAIVQQAKDRGLPINPDYVQKAQQSLDAAAAKVAQQQFYADQNKEYQSALPPPGSEKFNYNVANGFIIEGPGGYQYQAVGPNKATGAEGYWTVKAPDSKNYTTLDGKDAGANPFTTSVENENVNRLLTQLQNAGVDEATAIKLGVQGSDIARQALDIQVQANTDAQNAAIRAQNEALAAGAAERAQKYREDWSGETAWKATKQEYKELLYAVAAVAVVAGVGALVNGVASGATALAEGAEAATGLAEAGMSAPEIAATLEASGVETVAADLMAEQAVGIATGAVDAGSVLASSGVTSEMLAAANAVAADPMAALIAQAGWTTVDMSYLASIGAPAAILAAGEATNIALGAGASEIGATATAEMAGTVPSGTTAEMAANMPVAPTGAETVAGGPVAPAVDTSQMIPTVDAAGNPGFFDPATGNTLNAAGEVVAEGAMPAIGEGTQLAGEMTQGALGSGAAVSEAEFIAADAAQLAAQGLSEAQITQVLAASGVESGAAAAAAATAVGGAAAGGAAAGAAGGATTGGAATGGAVAPGAAAAEAEFIAADAAQLAAQGLSQAQIESTLVASGVDSFVAADAAQLATQGLGAGAISQNIVAAAPGELAAGAVAPVPAVGSGAYAPDNIDVGGGWNPGDVPVSDATPTWVNPNPTPDPTLGEAAWDYAKAVADTPLPSLGPKTWGDLALYYGASALLGPALVPEPPKIQRKTYAPIGDVTFGNVGRVNMPGTNPGQFVNVPAQYQQQSPVQSKFYWGQHPYQTGATFSPEQYQNIPAAPVQPWGLQQMYNPQTETINNLLSGVQQASTQAPYNVPKAPLV